MSEDYNVDSDEDAESKLEELIPESSPLAKLDISA